MVTPVYSTRPKESSYRRDNDFDFGAAARPVVRDEQPKPKVKLTWDDDPDVLKAKEAEQKKRVEEAAKQFDDLFADFGP